MFEPVKKGIGQFLSGYYASVVPTTKPLEEFASRGLERSIAWAPGRMVDAAEEMLALWLKSNIADQAPATQPPKLPVIMVAMAKDATPTGRDFGRQVADRVLASMPGDTKGRVFGLRSAMRDIRVQLVFFATDEPSASSLAAQFGLYLDASPNRRFQAHYTFAGVTEPWPVQIETPEVFFSVVQTEAKNLTILACDMTLRATVPLYDAPKPGEPNDGLGTPGSKADPSGYPLTTSTTIVGKEVP